MERSLENIIENMPVRSADAPNLRSEEPPRYATTSGYTDTERNLIDDALRVLDAHARTGAKGFHSPADVNAYCRLAAAGLEREEFRALWLDSQNRLICCEVLSRGTINAASVYAREVVKAALAVNAAAVIFTHNHPSGIAEPSAADRAITNRLKSALGLLDITVLDHIVTGDAGTVSFSERGWL